MNALSIVLLAISAPAALAAACVDNATSTIFVSSTWLNTNLANVTVLDARGKGDYEKGHLSGVARAAWQSFTAGCPGTTCGVLNTSSFMRETFLQMGVSPAKTVVIYDSWQSGWGDAGRIQWMLTSLGHKNSWVLYGGLKAYTDKYSPTLSTTDATPSSVNISDRLAWIRLRPNTGIVKTKAAIASTDMLIDTRTADEYSGAKSGSANYNVLRDGHATGAVLYAFSDFFEGACLKTCTAFKADLTSRGWTSGKKLVAYCTGGIRSAFFWSVATHCDIPGVSNYGGSMWEWASDSAKGMTVSPLRPAATSLTSDAKNMFSAGGLLLLALAPFCMSA